MNPVAHAAAFILRSSSVTIRNITTDITTIHKKKSIATSQNASRPLYANGPVLKNPIRLAGAISTPAHRL